MLPFQFYSVLIPFISQIARCTLLDPTLFFIIKYISQQQFKWLYYAAITFAFGFLNKYNIVFAVIGLLPAFYYNT